MQLARENEALALTADTYRLVFATDRPYIYLQDTRGTEIAELLSASSIHTLHGRDDTTTLSAWQVAESEDQVVFSAEATSALWKRKTYRLRCLPRRFEYEIEVEGAGQLVEVNYFGGNYSANRRWGAGWFWSGQHFQQVFNPEPNTAEENYLAPSSGTTIDLIGVPLPGRNHWFFTPSPFCFAFKTNAEWMSVGVQAGAGQNQYSAFTYHAQADVFYFSLAYDGKARVDGVYQLPTLGLDFAANEFDALEAHVRAVETKDAGPRTRVIPAWWSEPIFCGWGAQCYLAAVENGHAPSYCRQSHYEDFLRALDQNGVSPGTVVLDDKWQLTYGDNRADKAKWHDLRGFVDRQHDAKRHVLLWLQAWAAEGLPSDECVTNAAGVTLTADVTNPNYQERLRESVRHMLSPEGYNADGFKIDFTARIPSGPNLKTYADVWGLELMKLYLGIIYEQAKKTKPDALVITHTPHSYLAGVTDMLRLNDMNRDVLRAMSLRARVAHIACPNTLIDTDNWPIPDKATWREYTKLQPTLGVPALYYATHIDATREPLTADDYALVRTAWAQYRREHNLV